MSLDRRDHIAEQALLARSQRLARLVTAGWSAAVESRLTLGEERYGDAWTTRGAGDLIAEASEEARDLGAWSCLAVQKLAAAGLDQDARSAVAEMLARAVGAAAEAHAYLSAAETALTRTRA